MKRSHRRRLLALVLIVVPWSADARAAEDQASGATVDRDRDRDLETFLGLRALLFGDRSLAACARSAAGRGAAVERLDRLPAESKERFQSFYQRLERAYEHAAAGALAAAREELDAIAEAERNADYWLLASWVEQLSGDRARARAILHRLMQARDLGSRSALQYCTILRELGFSCGAERALGVVVELEHRGATIAVAGYADGTSRFLTSQGAALLGERGSFPAKIAASAKRLVALAHDRATMPVTTERALPPAGRVAIYLLTTGGVRGSVSSRSELSGGSGHAAQLWQAALTLLNQLWQVQRAQADGTP